MEGSGAQLAIMSGSHFEWISDTDERCGASTTALIRGCGMARAQVTYDANMFDTIDPDMGEPLCAPAHSDAELELSVQHRMAHVPMPTSLAKAEALLEELIGRGRAGPLSDLPAPTVSRAQQSVLTLHQADSDLVHLSLRSILTAQVLPNGKLTGSVNILKQCAPHSPPRVRIL